MLNDFFFCVSLRFNRIIGSISSKFIYWALPNVNIMPWIDWFIYHRTFIVDRFDLFIPYRRVCFNCIPFLIRDWVKLLSTNTSFFRFVYMTRTILSHTVVNWSVFSFVIFMVTFLYSFKWLSKTSSFIQLLIVLVQIRAVSINILSLNRVYSLRRLFIR